MLAARHAGYSPNTIPISAEMPNASSGSVAFTIAGRS
jgi:hypothetical protein